jgi:superfamily I DNA/RNA helicase
VDTQRRFRVVSDQAELAAALDASWDEWAVFLHPAQQEFVDRSFNDPARVIGSAGTGKTVVALHHAVRLAADAPNSRVLLTTFSIGLAKGLADKIGWLTIRRPALNARIPVSTLGDIARRLAAERFGTAQLASEDEIDRLVVDAAAAERAARSIPAS